MSLYTEYLAQLQDALDDKSSLGRLSVWLEKHTNLGGKPYSFKGHEFQRDIVDSKHANQVVIKPSQVGLTELVTRLILAFLAVEQNAVGMYLLPTVHEALRAAKSRIDPVIRGSRYLRSIMAPGGDSASFKQIGDSQLVMGGTFGKAIISVPTDILLIDELDFCNPEAVVTAESRLTHSRFLDPVTGGRGIKRKWSTPTAEGVGVHSLYEQSDRKKRLVKCKHCGHWFWPQWLKHVVVDGWDYPMDEMSYLDALVLEEKGQANTARILCERCYKPVTQDNLGPAHREWVAERPEIQRIEGFQVSPFDLPDYHSAASILRKLIEYRGEIGHFRNFVLGLAYSDASNSIVDAVVAENTLLEPIPPDIAEATGVSGCVAGLDIGRTSWMIIGKYVYPGKLHILWMEQIRLGENGEGLGERVLQLLHAYKVVKFVSDALPYTDTVLQIKARLPEGWMLPTFYNLTDNKLPMYQVQEADWTIKANRTKTLNYISKQANSGLVKWPRLDEMKIVRKHLQGMKRVDRKEDGGEFSEWLSNGDDHYFHALNYCGMAADLVAQSLTSSFTPMPGFVQAEVGSKYVKPPEPAR
jgi:hypothetical protein